MSNQNNKAASQTAFYSQVVVLKIACFGALISAFLVTPLLADEAMPTHRIQAVGLTDAEHTGSGGRFLNEAGQIAGTASRRQLPGQTNQGITAWYFDGTKTVKTGLNDAEHTAESGFRQLSLLSLNDQGYLLGEQTRYLSTGGAAGKSYWIYNGTETIRLGFYDDAHTDRSGKLRDTQLDNRMRLNAAGQVAGKSRYYTKITQFSGGWTPWLFDGQDMLVLGLMDFEHTNPENGNRSGEANLLNEAGQVAGRSIRFITLGTGQVIGANSAWFYDGSDTVRIGLIDDKHIRPDDGYSNSIVEDMDEAGQVLGTAYFYNETSDHEGISTWLFDGLQTRDVGLIDDRYKVSEPTAMNSSGQVIGRSLQRTGCPFCGSGVLSIAAWLYDGVQTLPLGLSDAEHTNAEGYTFNSTRLLNEAGQVVGGAGRWDGETGIGTTAWFYDGSQTIITGLRDERHTRDSDGFRQSFAQFLNEAGHVAGWAYHFDAGQIPFYTPVGQSSWVLIDGVTYPIESPSVRITDGFSSIDISKLEEDGAVEGSYSVYDETGQFLRSQRFRFTVAGGLVDIESPENPDPETFVIEGIENWESLNPVSQQNSQGQLMGVGRLINPVSRPMTYLLTPIPQLSVSELVEQSINNVLEELQAMQDAGKLKRRQANLLKWPLRIARHSLANENMLAVCRQLQSFDRWVRFATPGWLEPAQAEGLLVESETSQTLLECNSLLEAERARVRSAWGRFRNWLASIRR